MKPEIRERVLLACGVVGPALFVLVFLVEGVTRPNYDPLRHPVSSLALGETGWTQVVNFLVTGALILAFAIGLRPAIRRYDGGIWAPLLVGLVGVGLIGAGVFVTDPIGGYPPGSPLVPEGTVNGALHDAFSLPVFTALPAACFVVAYRFARSGRRMGWAVYSVLTAVVFMTCFVLASFGFSRQSAFVPVGGLFQRLAIIVGFAWIGALAVHLLRPTREPSR
ncbi:DUF998 domain-containing protein [Actinopolymorpha alba]|uniref:DUF998 domain-containing protein n=1 Tax=Actinopolymorpha alba TaxID=533267 RepID=UPI00036CF402|nr:DUF998 domain-containing protein [Actinopolymorpha alba]